MDKLIKEIELKILSGQSNVVNRWKQGKDKIVWLHDSVHKVNEKVTEHNQYKVFQMKKWSADKHLIDNILRTVESCTHITINETMVMNIFIFYTRQLYDIKIAMK